MFIGLKPRLQAIRSENLRNGCDENSPVRGTLAVINGPLDFTKTDGFIQFMELGLLWIPRAYGEQDPEWQRLLDKIRNFATCLYDANAGFHRNTKEAFRDYCEHTSKLLSDQNGMRTEGPKLDIFSSDDILPFLQKHVSAGNTRGFYCPETENVENALMNDLMEQLSGIKFAKGLRQYDISRFLTDDGYHEHIHDALNLLMQAAVYAMNCSSTRKCGAFPFDIYEMNNRLSCVESIIENIAHLTD